MSQFKPLPLFMFSDVRKSTVILSDVVGTSFGKALTSDDVVITIRFRNVTTPMTLYYDSPTAGQADYSNFIHALGEFYIERKGAIGSDDFLS